MKVTCLVVLDYHITVSLASWGPGKVLEFHRPKPVGTLGCRKLFTAILHS